jgi:hypothetical protein
MKRDYDHKAEFEIGLDLILDALEKNRSRILGSPSAGLAVVRLGSRCPFLRTIACRRLTESDGRHARSGWPTGSAKVAVQSKIKDVRNCGSEEGLRLL